MAELRCFFHKVQPTNRWPTSVSTTPKYKLVKSWQEGMAHPLFYYRRSSITLEIEYLFRQKMGNSNNCKGPLQTVY